MRFRDEWIELVPPAGDLEDLEDPLAQEALRRADRELEGLGVPVQRDALYWTFRIAQESRQLDQLASQVPWLDRIAVGFIDEETDGGESAFGLVCYANVPQGADGIDIPRLPEDSMVDVGPGFRAVMRVGERVPQVSVTSPSSAMVATWATSSRTGTGGWLVPAHAVDPHLPVEFSNNTRGRVSETWGSCIDAALVSPTAGGPPPALNLLPAVRGIAAGMDVSATDQHGRHIDAVVVDVDVNLGVVRHHLFPIRLSYTWQNSAPGDSGALVTASPCGEAVGMHQGAFVRRPNGGSLDQLAYALCLYQLEDYGGMEIYQ